MAQDDLVRVQRMALGAIDGRRRERLLRMLAAATFIIFFQAYMVAPIIPVLSNAFGTSVQTVGLIVPAYLIPYGIATLAYGILADRLGIHRVMFVSLMAFSALTMLTATAQSIEQLTLWRTVTGIGASGVVPLALALVGRLYPYEQRGRPLGWLFGAMAGGMAFGSPLGAMIVPFVGWQGLFVVVGAVGAVLLLVLLPYRSVIAATAQSVTGTLRDLVRGYKDLLGTPRGQRTYGFVLVNSIFHSGVFTWLGVYFEQRYGVGPIGIGLALLGYGVAPLPFRPPPHQHPLHPPWRARPPVRAADRSGGGSLRPGQTDTHWSVAERSCGGGTDARLPDGSRPHRRDGPVFGLRHDPTAFRGNCYLARRQTCRAGDGLERLHALHRLRTRKPHLRRTASLQLRGRVGRVRSRRDDPRLVVLGVVPFRGPVRAPNDIHPRVMQAGLDTISRPMRGRRLTPQ